MSTGTKGNTMNIQVVSTVNTDLSQKYDFGIHVAGCADVAKAKTRYGVTVYDSDLTPVGYITESENDFNTEFGNEPGSDTGLAYKIFPCCHKRQS
jgi:hypothetical protein